jgi:hypothetical protein
MSFERMTTAERHELDVVDAAVRGGGQARPEDAALTDFALLVRSARPLPDHGTALRLDERLVAPAAPGRRRLGLLSPLAGGLAALVLLVGVGGLWMARDQFGNEDAVMAIRGNSAGGDKASGLLTTNGAVPPQVEQKKAVPDSLAEADTVQAPEAASRGPRRVARDARLVLAAPAEKIERLADRVNAIADESGGFVQDARVSMTDGGRARASFLLMIPARTYQATLARLSRVGHVRSRSQGQVDITGAYNTNERALARSRARVRQLEQRLADADDAASRKKIAHDLTRAKLIERQAAARARGTRTRAQYVPLSLKIVADPAAADAGRSTLSNALAQAGEILTGFAAVLIVVLSVLLPMAVIGLIAWWGVRRWRRAQADATLSRSVAQSE